MSSYQRLSGTFPASGAVPVDSSGNATVTGNMSVAGAVTGATATIGTGYTRVNDNLLPAQVSCTANYATAYFAANRWTGSASAYGALIGYCQDSANYIGAHVRSVTSDPVYLLPNNSPAFVGYRDGNCRAAGYVAGSRFVQVKTANYTAVDPGIPTGSAGAFNTTDNGCLFDNTGAAAAVTITLPAATAGRTFSANSSTAVTSGMVLKAVGTDVIAGSGGVSAPAGSCTSGGRYGSVTLTCAVAGTWQVTAINGSWTIA